MGIFPKFRKNPKLNKKQKQVLGKELELDKFLTKDELQSFNDAKMQQERKREIWNRLPAKMKLAVGQKILSQREANKK